MIHGADSGLLRYKCQLKRSGIIFDWIASDKIALSYGAFAG
jgi:hypothetical protein